MTFEEADKQVRQALQPVRYQHTLGVVETAQRLACVYGEDVESARMAALLHDCAKYMPEEERVAYCESHGVNVNEAERVNRTLLHAKCGAIQARERYGIEHPEILHAIAVHTTGEPGMNTLDKIIFVADYIEPNRNEAPHLDELRKMSMEDLDATVYNILKDTLAHLKKKSALLDPTTKAAYEYYAALCGSTGA